MVRSHLSRSLHTSVPELSDSKDHSSQNRARRNRSPGAGQTNHGSSPKRNSSSWRPSPLERKGAPLERKGGDDPTRPRPHHRRDNARDNSHRPNDSSTAGGNRHSSSAAANNGRNQPIKRSKWRRNRNKKKRRKKGPPLSGANCAPVSGNRQPIASMRMRMDDYVTPRTGRLLPLGKNARTGNDIEHAVARARREASTRTKDTFWTKKLLDAESSHPNRWAHSGFKELYREELGYSEMEYKEREKDSSRRSPGRGTKRLRSPPISGKQRSPRDRYSNSRKTPKGKTDSRLRGVKSGSRSKSHSRSPRHRKRPRLNSPPAGGGRKSSYLKPNKRSFSRSLSRSPSSISSGSRSDSRSYSSYSRSSSRSSSSTSSSISSSTSGSMSFRRGRRKRRRSYSRSSKSWSRSPSPAARPPPRRPPKIKTASLPRPPKIKTASLSRPPKIKTASLSRAVQSVHAGKEKAKPLTKTVANEPSKGYYASPTPVVGAPPTKPKTKKARPVPQEPPAHHRRHGSPISSPPAPAHRPPVGAFYEKEIPGEKGGSSTFPDPIDKMAFVADPRRSGGAEAAAAFKATPSSGCLASHHHEAGEIQTPGAPPRSEGEQSNSESSSDEDELPLRMTLSERFGKLAQLSSQRQEYEGVRMKIVREGGQDKKVYLEGASRSPSPTGRRAAGGGNPAHERWLREHKAEYDEYEERYGEFRHWDPHRDLPRELPPNWDDVNVRYRYYKESGYFGERSITMEDYLKWEEWWYLYRNWLEKYGGVQEENLKYRSTYGYDVTVRTSTRERWMRREGHRDKEGGRKRHRY